MYEISARVRDNIISEFESELSNRDYEYNHSSIVKMFDEFVQRKNSLLEMLSKHPKWNAEKLMVHFFSDYNRRFETRELYNFVAFINKNIPVDDRVFKVLDFIRYGINDQFFTPEMDSRIAEINALNPVYHLRNNMKSSKAIGKICREEGWDKLDGYNEAYSKLCDCLNPIKVKRHTCISLNPLDFLLMSHGNSWCSCHYIDNAYDDPGCYSSGTISYMLDDCSFVFYTVDAEYNGDKIELEPKNSRQIFGYNDEVFLQSRLYPQANDSGADAVYTDIREIVQKVIADCIHKPNLWVLSKDKVRDIVEKGRCATCYPDWQGSNPGSSYCTISMLKERGSVTLPKIIMGAKPICIECGSRHNVKDNINCCRSESHYTCEGCGCNIHEDDVCWVGDYSYCTDCAGYCEDCDEYEIFEDMHKVYYIPGWSCNKETKYVCDCCYQNDYYRCDECGEDWHRDDITETESGKFYCPDCAADYVFDCDECGRVYEKDYLVYDEETEKHYCPDCYNDLIEGRESTKVCVSCGERCDNDVMHEVAGEWYCDDCYEELIEETQEAV